ncbi:MAG: hypothetical protein ACI4IQ_03410 [Eubacterium sp.]
MLWTIISENDIFASPVSADNSVRSSNPFDYIRNGYFVDNASLYGGKNYVNYNSRVSGNRSGNSVDIPDI